jgi:HD-like signal output (HDOD) protein
MVTARESNQILLEALGAGVELPRITAVGAELISALHMPMAQIDIHRIVSLVESDPMLTTAILRTANSAYFGGAREIMTVPLSITRIGLEDTIHILSYHCLHSMIPSAQNLTGFSSKDFWKHSWATATVARMLGQPQYLYHSTPGELYTAGLLHDMGKVVFAGRLSEPFSKACQMAREQGMPIFQAEMETLGVDHAKLGGHLLDNWNLPCKIIQAVSGHHDSAAADLEAREIARLVDLADAVAYHCGFADGTGQPARDPMQTAIARDPRSALGAPKVLERLSEDLKMKLSEKARIFENRTPGATGNAAPLPPRRKRQHPPGASKGASAKAAFGLAQPFGCEIWLGNRGATYSQLGEDSIPHSSRRPTSAHRRVHRKKAVPA